ncbi:MAG TPA: hypothetical protein VGN20_28240 [Mucilaginibacter sp.]|jgi:hypothetical protein
MSLQYLSGEKGQIVAVQIPIKEWELLKSKYPELEGVDAVLSDWQKDLIDARWNSIQNNPERVLPIDGLIAELDHPPN